MEETKMAALENVKTSAGGFELSFELKNVPVSFANAIRRITISGIPTVVIQDVSILENTSQMPHEMLKHRVEMLPINVTPDDASTIRDAKIELRIPASKDPKIVTTDDFTIESGREKILMRDRDLNTPFLFLKLKAGETIHIRGRLGINTDSASQVCTSTMSYHVDKDAALEARKKFIEEGNDPRHFDNFLYQRYYSKTAAGRPNWFDMSIESVGVLTSVNILKMAMVILRKRLNDYMKDAIENIKRESDEGSYSISLEQGGHTLGYLLQEVIYSDENVNFVSYDIPHPLKNTMIIRFNTKKAPESILRLAKETIEEYCSVVEKGL